MHAKSHLFEQTLAVQPAETALSVSKTAHRPSLISRFLPHDTAHTTCPPAPLVSGIGPVIIVPSLMRSGTHLLLDAMFNNFPALRRRPLFMDFDAYERASLDVAPLAGLTGIVIKTHYPQTPLRPEYASALAVLAGRAVVISPRRPAVEVRRSLTKWGLQISETEFAETEKRCLQFWAPYAPVCCEFATLLNPGRMQEVLQNIAERTGLPRSNRMPLMPAKTRQGVYLDKMLTRLFGCRVPRVNTTIGYRLAPRKVS